jgi:hypothetical protein
VLPALVHDCTGHPKFAPLASIDKEDTARLDPLSQEMSLSPTTLQSPHLHRRLLPRRLHQRTRLA